MIIQLIQNSALLLALCWLLTINTRIWDMHSTVSKLMSGLLFGLACSIGMLTPITLEPGLIIDARTVVLSMAALFGGPMVAGIAGLITGMLRLWLGGIGMWVGLGTIVMAIALGLTHRHLLLRGKVSAGPWQLFALGLLVQFLTLWLLLLLPTENAILTVLYIGGPVLLVMPVATVLLGLMLRGIEQHRQTELALMLSESRMRAITTAIPDTLLVLNEEGYYLEVIPGSNSTDTTAPSARIGQSVRETLAPSEAERFTAFINQMLASDSPQVIEYSQQTDNGLRFFEGHAQRLDTPLAGKQAVIILARDITQRVNSEHELRIAATAFETRQGLLITDDSNHILRTNQAFSDITGYDCEEVIGRKTSLLSSGRHSPDFYQKMWQRLTETGHWQGEIWNRRKNGEVFPEWLSISAVHNSRGQVINYVASIEDITDRKVAEKRIEHLAFFDALTGLPNRSLLLDRLQHAVDTSKRSGQSAALMFLDLDGFKNINDQHGHQTGDKLLQLVAERLSNAVRASDTVARLGGDEFIVMLEALASNTEEAAAQAEHTASLLLAALSETFQIGELELRSGASIGVTLVSDASCSTEELMQRADLSMYAAKAAGKHTVRFFDPHMQEVVSTRLRVEEEILQGLEAEAFIPYYQPQLDHAGGLVGAEVLARWQHPVRGLLSPVAFISVAEQAGLVEHIDFQMLQQACRQLAQWQRHPATASLSLAVNLSAHLLYQPDFVERLLQLLAQTGADPRHLKLELTESLLLYDVPDAISRMCTLKAHGIRFSIDDFGTGYSSLAYLQQLPLDQLKIDQSFVRELPAGTNSLAIIRAICALASSLQLEVIAEGVETEAQYTALLELGCQRFQGYLFGRPMPLIDFEHLLAAPASKMKPLAQLNIASSTGGILPEQDKATAAACDHSDRSHA